VVQWLQRHPRPLVTECLRQAVAGARQGILAGAPDRQGAQHLQLDSVLELAGALLASASEPKVREAINATGIILHTGLGRAVFPGGVVDSMIGELKGCVTLAVDRESGERLERDELIEPLLCELTGAEAATVVNNNAGPRCWCWQPWRPSTRLSSPAASSSRSAGLFVSRM